MGSNPIARSNYPGTNILQVLRPVNQGILGAWLTVGALILAMSYFGTTLRHLLENLLDGGSFSLVMGGALVAASGASLVWMTRRRSRRSLWYGLGLVLILLVITQMVPNPIEWLHFILFGAFGLLATRVWRPAAAVVICLSMSVGDEIFQWFLPDRVGDLRDVAMNIAACLLGAAVALIGSESA